MHRHQLDGGIDATLMTTGMMAPALPGALHWNPKC
jgi:hypothetical protein